MPVQLQDVAVAVREEPTVPGSGHKLIDGIIDHFKAVDSLPSLNRAIEKLNEFRSELVAALEFGTRVPGRTLGPGETPAEPAEQAQQRRDAAYGRTGEIYDPRYPDGASGQRLVPRNPAAARFDNPNVFTRRGPGDPERSAADIESGLHGLTAEELGGEARLEPANPANGPIDQVDHKSA